MYHWDKQWRAINQQKMNVTLAKNFRDFYKRALYVNDVVKKTSNSYQTQYKTTITVLSFIFIGEILRNIERKNERKK